MKQMIGLGRCQRGATAVEYGLICALIVLAMVGGIGVLGGGLASMWGNVATAVSGN